MRVSPIRRLADGSASLPRPLPAGVLCVAVLASSALAAPELLTPLEPAPPDGFEVVVPGGGALEARGASVSAASGGAGRYQVKPEPGAKEVTLSTGGLSKRLVLGPPPSVVTLSLSPRDPVKGRDTEAKLEVTVNRPDGQPDPDSAPPVLRANVGTVEALERVSLGRYRGRYVLPKTRYPEVAIIVAFAAWPHPQAVHGATGVLRVPLASAVEVPGRTEAHADMTLTIAGTTFGPTRAGGDGAFRLPVVVPPGYGLVSGTATDRMGNRKTVKFDLHLPRTDQLACVANPVRLPADGLAKARVLCAISDVYGGVTQGSKVTLASPLGSLSSPREPGAGLMEWTWTAPDRVGQGRTSLTAAWKQGGFESKEELLVELLGAPVARVELAEPPLGFAHAGGVWRARVRTLDAAGSPVPGAWVRLRGARGWITVDEAGLGQVEWAVPDDAARGPTELSIDAFGPPGVDPARLFAWEEGGKLLGAVTDLAGYAVPSQELKLDGASVTTGDDGVAELGLLERPDATLSHGQWSGLRELVRRRGGSLFPGRPPPGRARLAVTVDVGPRTRVVVRLERVQGGWSWWLESSSGALLEGREVEITVDGRSRRARSGRPARLDGAGESVAVVDVETHVGSLAGGPP